MGWIHMNEWMELNDVQSCVTDFKNVNGSFLFLILNGWAAFKAIVNDSTNTLLGPHYISIPPPLHLCVAANPLCCISAELTVCYFYALCLHLSHLILRAQPSLIKETLPVREKRWCARLCVESRSFWRTELSNLPVNLCICIPLKWLCREGGILWF